MNLDAMVFSRRKRRIFDIVRTVAMSSAGVGGRNGNNFRVGAVIVRKHTVQSAGVNSYKSRADLLQSYVYPILHAEAAAIFKCGLDNCYGADLYVGRVLRNNNLAMAKPCSGCQQLIKEAGINNIYFSTNYGFEKL